MRLAVVLLNGRPMSDAALHHTNWPAPHFEQLRRNQKRHRRTVMHRNAGHAEALIKPLIQAGNVPDKFANLARLGAQLAQIRVQHQRFQRNIQPHGGQRPACAKNLIGGQRIAMNIRLARRRDIAEMAMKAKGPAHNHHLLDQRRDIGRGAQSQRQIGHAANRDNANLMRMRPHHINNKLVSGARVGFCSNHLRQSHIAKTVMSMYMSGRFFVRAIQRQARPLRHRSRNFKPLFQIQRIARGHLNPRIAHHRGDANQINQGRTMQKQQGHRIINAGVCVVDYFVNGHREAPRLIACPKTKKSATITGALFKN